MPGPGILDRYVAGTRLRLREVRGEDGTVTRKLGQKVRLSDGPAEVACTNLYLDDSEWAALAALMLPVLLVSVDNTDITGPESLEGKNLCSVTGSTSAQKVKDDQPGYWETRGYHNHADPWKEERYG